MSRRRAIPGITQHMLTTQLRELESDGLVRCKIFAEVPPRVEYAITPAARALTSVIDAVFACWRNHERAALGSKHREEQPTKLRGVTESANVPRIFVTCRKHRETKRWTSL
jgi:DNA-binding HxlR family transcriptional regulator